MKRTFAILLFLLYNSFNSQLLATPTDDLLDAALKGDLQKAEAAIKAGADVNGKNYAGRTALLQASRGGHLEIAKLLIENKADIFIEDDSGRNAIEYATVANRKQLFEILINNKFFLLEISGSFINFFKLCNNFYLSSNLERKDLISKLIKNIKLFQKEIEKLKTTTLTYLWFLYELEGSQESLKDAEEIFSGIDHNLDLEKILSNIGRKPNPEIYYLIALYYSKEMNFLTTDKFISLSYQENISFFDKAEKREDFHFYFYNSEQFKMGLPYQLKLKEKVPHLLIQNGHSQDITNFTFSPDGKTIATASEDNTAKIWNLQGKLLADLKGHFAGIRQITFSPDGKKIATSSRDKTVKLWNREGNLLTNLAGYTDDISHVTFSPNGNIIATSSYDGSIKIWDLKGSLLASFNGGGDFVSFSPDSKMIAFDYFSNSIKLLEISNKNGIIKFQHIIDIKEHSSVDFVTFSPDGKKVLTGSRDQTAKLWNLKGKLIADLKNSKGLSNIEKSVKFSPDGKIIATISSQQSIKIWNWDGKLLASLQGYDVVFSPNGKMIATCTNETVKLWDLDGNLLTEIKGHTDSINHIAFSPDGKMIAISSNESFNLWDLEGRIISNPIKGRAHQIYNLAFSPDENMILTIDDSEDEIQLWNRDGHLLVNIKGHTHRINNIIFSPDGKIIATISRDKTAKIWNLEGQLLANLKEHTGSVNSLTFSPNSKVLVTTSEDNTAKVWNLEGKLLADLKGHTDWVINAKFSLDEKTIVTVSKDGIAKVWNQEGSLLTDINFKEFGYADITFSPDGNIIATTTSDRTINIWNLNSKLLANLKGRGPISFSPDGKTIAFNSPNDLKIILWNLNNETTQKTFEGHTSGFSSVKFIKNGKILVSAAADNTIKYWDMNAKKSDSGLLLTQQLFNNGEGLVFTPDGRYDYTSDSIKDFVSFKVAGQFIELDDIDDHYRIKGLREKVLSGEIKPMDSAHIARMAEDLPTIKVVYPTGDTSTSKNIQDCKVKIKSKTLKISKVEAWVNGSKSDISKEFAKGLESEYEAEFKFKVNLKQGQNYVKILAYNEFNLPSSHLIDIKRDVKGKAEPVNLYVLSIGVNEYSKNKSKNLKFSEHDAVEFAKVLESQKENGLYKNVFVNRLVSSEKDLKKRPTKSNILAGLEEIRKNASPDDVVVVYYSGHGMSASLGSSNLFYLVPEDFDWSLNPESSVTAKQEGVDAETMGEILSRVKSHKVVLFIDACHSGDILLAARGEDKQESTNSGLKRMANGTGRFIFASSAGDEKSRESKQIGHGLFTYVLLNALGAKKSPHGTADLIKDKEIKLQEIDTYISETFQKQISTLIKSEIQSPIPMRGLGRYQDRSKAIDFPLIKLK